jgi:hypothetical protein
MTAKMTSLPTLAVVSGPAGSGKTTLAHRPGLREIVAFVNAGGSRRQPQAADDMCEPDS